MILKSAQIKRIFYPESSSGRDVIILTDYEEEIQRIKRECADRFIKKYMSPRHDDHIHYETVEEMFRAWIMGEKEI